MKRVKAAAVLLVLVVLLDLSLWGLSAAGLVADGLVLGVVRAQVWLLIGVILVGVPWLIFAGLARPKVARKVVGGALDNQDRRRRDTRRIAAVRARLDNLETAKDYEELGNLLGMNEQWEEAADAFTRGLELEETPALLYGLGAVRLHQGRPDQAVEPLSRCRELRPDYKYGGAALRLAQALAESGRREKAMELYADLVLDHYGIPEAHVRYGDLLAEHDREDEAREQWRIAAETVSALPAYKQEHEETWGRAARRRLAGA